MRKVGIDFGTTNSAVALWEGDSVRVARFPFLGSLADTFRSILFFESPQRGKAAPAALAGPAAIERYLEPHDGGRLIQSLKSFAANRTFQQTIINGTRYALEDLIGIFLRIMRRESEKEFGPLGDHAVVGRPVKFVGGESPEAEQLALSRLTAAFGKAGWNHITFEYEPVGAANSYAQRLSSDELVLIGDFGGGTSDFSLLKLGARAMHHRILATAGVPVGGDVFDCRIVRNLVSPLLGLGSTYRSMGKVLPVPISLYFKVENWHHLSFLRSRENLQLIQGLLPHAEHPEQLTRLIEIVESDLGYQMHRSVQRTKVDLSAAEQAEFSFSDSSLDIRQRVTREEFEGWIAKDLETIRKCVEKLLRDAGAGVSEIDRVFLTGGSSLVPSVARIFSGIFGEEKLASGEEFTSVAKGLAQK